MAERNLDKERDERTVPVARKILHDMATDVLPVDENLKRDYREIVLKLLTHQFEADLNLTYDNPYVLQLLQGVFSRVNIAVQGATTIPMEQSRYTEIARKVLAIVDETEVSFLIPKKGEGKEDTDMERIVPKINTLFAEEKLNWMEVKYVMDLIFTAWSVIQGMATDSIAASLRKAESKAMGVDDLDDLTMKGLDRYLVLGEKPE